MIQFLGKIYTILKHNRYTKPSSYMEGNYCDEKYHEKDEKKLERCEKEEHK